MSITLEAQVADHAEELFGLLDDEQVHGFTDSEPPGSLASLRARLAKLETRQSPDGTEQWLNWIVRDAGGQMLGYVQATVTPDGVATLGVVIGRPFWGQGHGPAAVRAMVALLERDYGVAMLRATVDPLNARSAALFAGLGMGVDAGEGDLVFRSDIATVLAA